MKAAILEAVNQPLLIDEVDIVNPGPNEVLVRTALDSARAAGRRVVPQCSYVARFIAKHPEYQLLVDA